MKNYRQHLGNVQKHDERQEIEKKILSTTPNLNTYCNFKTINLKKHHHTGGMWFIQGTKRCTENQLQSPKHSRDVDEWNVETVSQTYHTHDT